MTARRKPKPKPKPKPKLCPLTLAAVAAELGVSANAQRKLARQDARERRYLSAHTCEESAKLLEFWAAHFLGAAKW